MRVWGSAKYEDARACNLKKHKNNTNAHSAVHLKLLEVSQKEDAKFHKGDRGRERALRRNLATAGGGEPAAFIKGIKFRDSAVHCAGKECIQRHLMNSRIYAVKR